MSNHFQHHTDDSTDFFSGDNALFDDSIWNDNQYPGLGPDLQNGGDNASHAQNGQAWAYAPESLGLAGRADDQYAWDNSIDSNHYYSNGVSNNQFSNDHEADRAGNGNAYQPPPSRLRQDIPEPQAQSFNSGLTSNNAFSASPYAFENARPNHQTLQGSAISPHALQLSEPRKAPTSRESTPSVRANAPTSDHLFRPIPKGNLQGKFLVTTIDDLNKLLSSRPLTPFVDVASTPHDVMISRTAIPSYVPRKSRNQLMKLLASNDSLKAKIDKKLSKKLAKQSSQPASTSASRSEVPKKRTAESASEPSSEDDSSSDDSEEESMQAPIPAKRPTDNVLAAVKYDTIKALWRVPYRSVPADDIRKAMQEFWEVVQTLQDRWKSDAAAVKTAEEAKKVNELPMLKERVAIQRDMLRACLKAASEQGHRDILEHFGQHLTLLGALAVFIQDRLRDSEYSGSLIKTILEFLSKCKSMTTGFLERSQLTKVFQRLSKRGDDDVKTLTKRIIDNSSLATQKQRGDSGVAKVSATSKAQPAKTAVLDVKKAGSPVAGVKRQREAESDVKPPLKKLAGYKPALKGSLSVVSKANSTKKLPNDTKPNQPPVATSVKKVLPKTTTNIFASLTPGYKKPGTTSAARIMGTDASQPKAAGSASSSAPVKAGGFSFADAMASLAKVKEPEEEAAGDENAVTESPEERKKRQRKEARRKLRVSFKPESELTEIKYFEHDPEEELGHDEAQSRDVNSHQNEGQMLKMHLDPDKMDLDEDDDQQEDLSTEPVTEYRPPSEIDFGDMPAEERNRMYYPYGGSTQKAESPEQEEQTKREANSLSVIYSTRAEIPNTPKEPIETVEEPAELRHFGQPPNHLANVVAKYEAQEKERQAQVARQAPPMPDLTALLAKIQQPPQQPMHQAQAPPNQNIQDILARLGHPQQPGQQQGWQPNAMHGYQNQQQYPYQQQQPWANGGWNPQQQQLHQPPMHQQPQQAAPDINAILASLTGAIPQSQQPQNPGFPSMGGGAQGMPMMGGFAQQNAQQQQIDPGTSNFENEERRQLREGVQPQAQPQQQQTAKPAPYKVVVCKYWKEGKCLKGDNCTFKHED